MSDLQDIREMNAYQLANLTGCGEPGTIKRDADTVSSPGADFLESVRDDFLERFDYAIEHNGTPTADDIRSAAEEIRDEAAHEIADGAVPVYTYQRWQTFADLAAWEEDTSELASGGQDMTALAGVALYMIAERLVRALAESLDEWADDIEANETDADDDERDDQPVRFSFEGEIDGVTYVTVLTTDGDPLEYNLTSEQARQRYSNVQD